MVSKCMRMLPRVCTVVPQPPSKLKKGNAARDWESFTQDTDISGPITKYN